MILFLTYHKVRPEEAGKKAEFYTVTPDQLENHLELLDQGGVQPLKGDELLTNPSRFEPRFLLSFDDGSLDHYEIVLPILQRHRCQAVFFVVSSRLNRPGYLAAAQVRELAAAGQIIGAHSHEHRRLDTLDDEDIRVQIELSQQILGEILGSPPVYFAPPGGFTDRRVRGIALERGMKVIRTMRWGYNKHPDLTQLESVPINRHTGETAFRRILQLRGRPLMYTAKESIKWLLPMTGYEWVRDRTFRLTKRN